MRTKRFCRIFSLFLAVAACGLTACKKENGSPVSGLPEQPAADGGGSVLGDKIILSGDSGGHVIAVIDPNGDLWTCGFNQYGQLGNGTLDPWVDPLNPVVWDLPVKVLEGKGLIDVCTTARNTFVIDKDGMLWGCGYEWRLGLEGAEKKYRTSFVPIAEGVRFSSVRAGTDSAIALDVNGGVWSWGDMSSMLSKYYYATPTRIVEDVSFKKICMGTHVCLGIDRDGALWGWGCNSSGQLASEEGIGNSFSFLGPRKLVKDVKFCEIYADVVTVSALDESGNIWTCGENMFGQLGDGTMTDRFSFARIESDVKFKALGGDGICCSYALDEEGFLWGWGLFEKIDAGNLWGFITDDERHFQTVPTKLTESVKFSKLTGLQCAITEAGELYVWGYPFRKNRGEFYMDPCSIFSFA